MIISMDDYRRIDSEYDASAELDRSGRRYTYGNPAPALRLATVESEAVCQESPDLPDNFDDFDAKEFIDRAYDLATQI